MASKTSRGLVLFERPFGETDKILTIFSEAGKFRAIAHGSRLPKSKIAAGTRLFSWSNFVYSPGKTFARIHEANLIEPFLGISEDVEKMTYASYAMDLINTFYEEDEIDRTLLKLAVYYLYYLSHTEISPRLLTLAFQLKLLVATGYRPLLGDYNEVLTKNRPVYFRIKDGVFSSEYKREKTNFSYRIEPESFKIIIDLLKLPMEQIKEISVEDEEEVERLIQIFNHFLEYNAGSRIRSYKIITDMHSFLGEKDE